MQNARTISKGSLEEFDVQVEIRIFPPLGELLDISPMISIQ